AERMNRIHHEGALYRNEAANTGVASLELLCHQAVRHAGHSGAAVALQAGAEEAEFAELRNQMHGESGFAAVLFDDGDDFVLDELAGGLTDQFFLVVQLRVKIDVIHSGIFGHAESSLRWLLGAYVWFVFSSLPHAAGEPGEGELRAEVGPHLFSVSTTNKRLGRLPSVNLVNKEAICTVLAPIHH